MPQKCSICKITKIDADFSLLKRKGNEVLAKSCKECNFEKSSEQKRARELKYQHLWTREDGSKITDPWEVVDDHKIHTCKACNIDKSVQEFVIFGSKYNPKLSMTCKTCLDVLTEEVERRKRGDFKKRMDLEWCEVL